MEHMDEHTESTDDRLEPLMRASRVVTAAIVRSLSRTEPELTVTQLRVLAMVSTREQMSVGDVAAALDVNASNASRTCDRLASAGLLHRRPSSADRRLVCLELTGKGHTLVDSVLDQRREMLASVLAGMPKPRQDHLLEALDEFSAAAARLSLIRPEESGDEHLMAWLR
jgi:DNA-binding MarR family transcriptional regulator